MRLPALLLALLLGCSAASAQQFVAAAYDGTASSVADYPHMFLRGEAPDIHWDAAIVRAANRSALDRATINYFLDALTKDTLITYQNEWGTMQARRPDPQEISSSIVDDASLATLENRSALIMGTCGNSWVRALTPECESFPERRAIVRLVRSAPPILVIAASDAQTLFDAARAFHQMRRPAQTELALGYTWKVTGIPLTSALDRLEIGEPLGDVIPSITFPAQQERREFPTVRYTTIAERHNLTQSRAYKYALRAKQPANRYYIQGMGRYGTYLRFTEGAGGAVTSGP